MEATPEMTMNAAGFSEMSIHMYQNFRCYIPEDSNLQNGGRLLWWFGFRTKNAAI
jgi:hypothetical protein